MLILKRDTVTVYRTASGSYSADGESYVPGATSTFTVKCHVQAVGGDTSVNLPEGMRSSRARVLMMARNEAKKLRCASQDDNVKGDIVTIEGDEYEVTEISDNTCLTGAVDNYEVLVIRRSENG